MSKEQESRKCMRENAPRVLDASPDTVDAALASMRRCFLVNGAARKIHRTKVLGFFNY